MNKQLHTFNGMSEVKTKYAASKMTDTQFAEQISAVSGQQYSCAQVRAWRQALDIPNNKPADARDQMILELRSLCREMMEECTRRHGLNSLTPEIVRTYNRVINP